MRNGLSEPDVTGAQPPNAAGLALPLPAPLQSLHALAAAGWLTLWRSMALMALALMPSSYLPAVRRSIARELALGVAPLLPWFAVLAALVGLVLTRIIVATAYSYGLAPYALDVLIRVLVLELIPLSAAAFVAMRYALPQAAALAEAQRLGPLPGPAAHAPLQFALLPRVVAGWLGVLLLAVLASVMTLVLVYVYLYGLSPWGVEPYTRQVGTVFSPAVTLILALKTLACALAVALVPMATCLRPPAPPPATASGASSLASRAAGLRAAVDGGSPELRALLRVGVLLLAIEVLSLIGHYA